MDEAHPERTSKETGEDFYTPAGIAEKVRSVLGDINLDPALVDEQNPELGWTRA